MQPPGRTPGPWPGPPGAPAPTPPDTGRRATWLRWGKRAAIAALVWIVVTPVVFRVWTPPRTMFMLTDEAGGPTVFQAVSLDHISRHYVAAVLVHEDARLGTRTGPFDVGVFNERVGAFLSGEEDPSGSTIPQQLVKNMFLIRGEWQIVKAARKVAESVLSYPYNLMGDKRQLELYLNYAQFGPNLYGVCAASWYYFNRPPWDGNPWDAATLAGLLPLGEDVRRAPGGGVDIESDGTWLVASTVANARNKVPQRIREMGGWEGVVATVGITDAAGDHTLGDDAGSCSAMPQSVADRLEAEGAR
ncbi:biosynthetic peptidoglycan transglycosylase [Rhodococcus tukisamuensis]|uniref:biosynthetic peptidoglycan transglycosylase n=1 Tax=Rhodococcus tukisamuensis TaxID=168276 RepID=UPI000B865577|nr:biosynthetic peptidoglycan transglycosylase [Rhodococcus tukisamuensis]